MLKSYLLTNIWESLSKDEALPSILTAIFHHNFSKKIRAPIHSQAQAQTEKLPGLKEARAQFVGETASETFHWKAAAL